LSRTRDREPFDLRMAGAEIDAQPPNHAPHLRSTAATMRSRPRRRGRNLHSVYPADIYYHCAPKPAPSLTEDPADHTPASLAEDQDDNAPQYVGQVHNFPSRSTRSGRVRCARRGVHSLLSEHSRSLIRCSGPHHRPLVLRQFETRSIRLT